MDRTIIFHKAYDCYASIAALTEHFPKKDRYGIGVRLDTLLLELLETIVTAEVTADVLKDRALIETTAKADVSIVLIRLALERKLINTTNYFRLTETLSEISKMATGWRKSILNGHR